MAAEIITATGTAKEVALPPERVEAIRHAIAGARSKRTREAYQQQFGTFCDWCTAHGRAPVPASIETVAGYLTALQDGTATGRKWAPSSIEVALSAIIVANRLAGNEINRKATVLADAVKSVKQNAGAQRTARRVHPIRATDVERLLDVLTGADLRTIRDAAIIALGFAAALRRSELVGLDVGELTTGTGALVVTDDGLDVVLATSKADQGREVRVAVPREDVPTLCDAVTRWIEVSGVQRGGPLFQSINKGGKRTGRRLTGTDIARIIKARVKDHPRLAHLVEIVSGHSLRAGCITSLSESGASIAEIQPHSRHATADMVGRYVRDVDRWKRNPLGKLGRG